MKQTYGWMAAAALAVAIAATMPVSAQQAPAPAQAPAMAAGGPPARQGGSGPIRVLFISKGHDHDREGLMKMLDRLGNTITWTHVEHPAATAFYDPANAKDYDVYLFYDAPGRGQPTPQPNGQTGWADPGFEAKKNFAALTQSGKVGLVYLHHSPATFNHTWPEYGEMIGMACDWGAEVTFKGKKYPNSGARGGTKQHITVLEPSHPVVQGLGEGFDIVDETYLCPVDEKSVHPLLKTDFVNIDKNYERRYETGWRYPGVGSSLAGWYRAVGKTPLVYLQNGHDNVAWSNPAYETLVTNAIKWVVSPEAKAWAVKNGKPMGVPKAPKTSN
jgi:hypothetical protein